MEMTTGPGEERRRSPSPPHRSLWWIIISAGLVAALALVLLGALTLLFSLDGDLRTEMQVRQGIGTVGLGTGLAVLTAGMGWRLKSNRPSSPFLPRRLWLLGLVFLAVLITGAILSALPFVPTFVLAVLSTLAMILFPLLTLGAMGRVMRGKGGTWADAMGGLIAGASLGTGAAAAMEGGMAALALLLFVGYATLFGHPFDLMALIEQGQQPDLLTAPRLIADLLTNPLAILLILLTFAVIVPLVEETAKTLGVGLLGRWLRPRPARAFLLGIASGAGFALAENVLNVSLFEGAIWTGAVLSRVLATLMHCATGGLMGWGWGELWTARRPGRLVLSYLLAVSVHGLWNGLAVTAAMSGIALAEMEAPTQVLTLSVTVGVSTLTLLFLAALCLIGMPWAGRVLARRAP